MNNRPVDGTEAMCALVSQLPDQLRGSATLPGLESVAPLRGLRRVVICGMGGSAIAGDLVAPLLESGPVALTVWRDYGLPHWVAADDLVVASSYSGQTEETLAAFAAAGTRGCRRLALATGGALAAGAREAGVPLVELPPGLPPRASLGWGLGALLRALGRMGVVANAPYALETAAAALQRAGAARELPGVAAPAVRPTDPDGNPPVATVAAALAGRMPVIYTCGGESHGAGLRLRAQLNENAKVPAALAAFPELDHNDLVGWDLIPADRERFVLLILRAADENPRTSLRVELTRDLLADQFACVYELRGGGADVLTRILSLVQYGDYLSCHLAARRGVDAMPVDRIVKLKEALARAQSR
jgi:glucose/mannose-6-phosphate isomerase